jgi:hypothetical protein
MKPIKLSPAAALVIATALVGAANAQAPSPSGGDHESHHPPAASEAPAGAPTQPSAQSQTGSGGMMGPGMMGPGMMGQGMMGQSCMAGTTGQNSSTGMMCMRDMMSMMGNNMMGAQSGMMASNIEGRITALKTELKITDTQTPAWNRFAEALRATAGSMNAMYEQMMQSGAAATLPARLERPETMLSAHLNRVKTLKEVLDPLYASLAMSRRKSRTA